jgi:hypothetical protein
LVIGVYNLCDQTSRITGSHPHPSLELSSDPANPYAYSHTVVKVLKLVSELKRIAAEEGDHFSAQVINTDQGWPLPWYWRMLPRIGYQAALPDKISASVVIVDADLADAAEQRMSGEYQVAGQYNLRPGVLLVMYVKKAPSQPQRDGPGPATPLPPGLGQPQPPGTLNMPPPAFSPEVPPLPGVRSAPIDRP